MCPNELVASITALATIIAKDKSANEISIIALIFTQLGDTLATIALQMTNCNSK